MKKSWGLCLSLFSMVLLAHPTQGADDYAMVVDKAIAFLEKSQNEDGSWGNAKNKRGVTGIVLTGLLKSGRVKKDSPTIQKALKYIESLVNEKGHLAGPEAAVQLQNYVTSVNIVALQTADSVKYKPVIDKAVAFLKKLQWDEEEGKKADDDFFGGAGYDSKSRPDLSNTQFFLDALHAAGVKSDDPAMKKALVFVSRCQNLKSEFNDQPWAGKINDGSFIYSAAAGGSTKTSDDPNNTNLTGYGSMTYAGIKSMIYCGVSKEDPRYKKAWEWIKANYTVDANPGMPKELAERGLYYYYHTMAKTLHVIGEKEIVDAKGNKHDWRADILAALKKRQKEDGSWTNTNDRWMEGDPNLVAGYALMALSYCQPVK